MTTLDGTSVNFITNDAADTVSIVQDAGNIVYGKDKSIKDSAQEENDIVIQAIAGKDMTDYTVSVYIL